MTEPLVTSSSRRKGSLPFKVLTGTKVIDILVQKRHLVLLHSSQTVEQCLEELTREGITAAPVVDLDTGHCLGFLDMLDLVAFALDIAGNEDATDTVSDVVSRFARFGSALCRSVVAKAGGERVKSVGIYDTLDTACMVFASGSHRVGVLGNDGKLTGILTQSDVIAFLYANKKRPDQPSELPSDLLDTPLSKLTATIRSLVAPVIAVNEDENLYKAYQTMVKLKVGGVGVVNSKGILVGNLSAWDLKYMNHRTFISMTEPVKLFLERIRAVSMSDKYFVVGVKLKHTVGQAMDRMVTNRVHRLYVVNDELKPTGVLTIGSLIKLAAGLETA